MDNINYNLVLRQLEDERSDTYEAFQLELAKPDNEYNSNVWATYKAIDAACLAINEMILRVRSN